MVVVDNHYLRHGLFTDVRLAAWSVLAQSLLWCSNGPFSTVLFSLSVVILAVGLIVGLLFVRFVQRHVFNRELSPSARARAYTYCQLLLISHPLEIVWRFMTAWARCAPDLYIVGETRCGTTSLSSMLADHMDVRGPFTPYVHPVLAGKESFYLVGHYWGFVHPYFYRMCFPTLLEKWLYERVHGRRMIVYDGCAQYLNSAWCAGLIRRVAPSKQVVIVACVREPLGQNVSWWEFEQNAIKWGDSLGMPKSSPSFRIKYPPRDLAEAIRLSESKEVKDLFKRSEALTGPLLPSWAIPTPNGQLSGLTHMTSYATNISRYLSLFGPESVVVSSLSGFSANPKGILTRVKKALMRPHYHHGRNENANRSLNDDKPRVEKTGKGSGKRRHSKDEKGVTAKRLNSGGGSKVKASILASLSPKFKLEVNKIHEKQNTELLGLLKLHGIQQ